MEGYMRMGIGSGTTSVGGLQLAGRVLARGCGGGGGGGGGGDGGDDDDDDDVGSKTRNG
jgi:hypothetical protein